jgi:hypothetical protein
MGREQMITTNPITKSITSSIVSSIIKQTATQPSLVLDSPSSQNIDIENYNPDQGAMYIDLTHTNAYSYTNFETVFSVSDGTNNNRMLLQFRSSGRHDIRLVTGGSSQVNVNASYNLSFIPKRKKYAFYWKDGLFRIYLNGAMVLENNSVTMPTSVSVYGVGQFNNGSAVSTGTINEFKAYTTAPTEQEMRDLTRNDDLIDGLTGSASRIPAIFMGQSNSSGRASTNPTYANTINALNNAGSYGAYSDPYDDDTGQLVLSLIDTGADGSYAGVVLDELGGDPYFSVSANLGNTDLVNPTASKSFRAYQTNISTTDKFMRLEPYGLIMSVLMASQAAGGRKDGVIVWHQGENDAAAGQSASDYKEAWKELFNEIKAATGFNGKIIVNSLHEWDAGITTATETNWNTISDALLDINYSNTASIDISDIAGAAGDKVHLDQSGNETVGARIAALV